MDFFPTLNLDQHVLLGAATAEGRSFQTTQAALRAGPQTHRAGVASGTWGPCDASGAASRTPSHSETGQLPPSSRASPVGQGKWGCSARSTYPSGPLYAPSSQDVSSQISMETFIAWERDVPCTQLWVPLSRRAPGHQPSPSPDRGQAPSPRGCLAGHLLRCTSQSYLGVREPRSGGPLTRGSISEVQGSRRPGRRTRWMPLAPPWGRPRVSMQTPRTGSGLGEGVRGE